MFKKSLAISLLAVMLVSTSAFAGAYDTFKKEVTASTKKMVDTTVQSTTTQVNKKTQAQINAINKKIAAKEAQITKIKNDADLTAKQKKEKVSALNSEIKQLKSDLKTLQKSLK